MRIFLLIFSFLLIAATSLQAQNQKQWFALGDRALQDEDYLVAADCFERAYELDSADFEATTRYADALRYIRNYRKAEYLYEKAYNKDKGRLFPMGQFYLAQMQKRNGHYKEALRNFKKFGKKQKRDKEGYLFRKCEQEIESCTFAINARRKEGGIAVSSIQGDVNGDRSEFSPWLADSTLLFTREDFDTGRPSLQQARLNQDSTFVRNKAYNITWETATEFGNLVFSPDSARAYYVTCEDSTCILMESQVIQGRIQPGVSIPTINQSGVTCSSPWVASIGPEEVLLFSSDRPGTFGKMDLWWSVRKSDGSWTAPANMGEPINTPDDEVSPCYIGNTLYFSSDWHTGFGGLDVFKAEGTHRRPGKPENIGYPVNSPMNDFYYRYFPSSRLGMLVSNRRESGDNTYCCTDLYRIDYRDSVETEEPDVFTSLKQLNDYLPVTLYFHNDEPNPNSRDTTTSLSYADCYRSYIDLRKTYLRENARGLRGEEKEEAEYDVEDFYTFQVEKGWQDLQEFARLLLEELEKGYSIELVIKGFASPRAESDYNVNLTRRRIASLVNFLEAYKSGAFLPYFDKTAENHATLTIAEVPFGEYEASQTVSDDLQDEKQSIYSRGARMERKIEVQSVQKGTPDSLFSAPSFDRLNYDFGRVHPDLKVATGFVLTNEGTDTLQIDSVLSSCGCTVPVLEKMTLLPEESMEIEVGFDPTGLEGTVSRKVLLFMAHREEPYVLTIQAAIKEE